MAAGPFALPVWQHHKRYKYSHNKMSYLARSFASIENNNDKSGGTKDGNKANDNTQTAATIGKKSYEFHTKMI